MKEKKLPLPEIDYDIIAPTINGWKIIEDYLVECGMPRPNANHASKAIVARLAGHEPSILLCYPDQIKEGDEEEE